MSNPWGDTASLYFFYVFLCLIFLFVVYLIFRCIKNRSSPPPTEEAASSAPLLSNNVSNNATISDKTITNKENTLTISSRNSSIDKIFNEFQKSVSVNPKDSVLNSGANLFKMEKKTKDQKRNKKMAPSISVLEEGMKKNNHINALLNLLAVKEVGEMGLGEENLETLRRKVKIFTHEDFNSINVHNNTTSHIENLSKSFCLNNDENIRTKPSCMYCLENINIGDRVIYLPTCKHLFHENCFADWFSKKSLCPICKKHPLVEVDESQILDVENMV